MATSVQVSAAQPKTSGLAAAQTPLGDQDARQRSVTERDRDGDDFADYLNRTSIETVEKTKPAHRLDAADMISQSSVYVAPTLFSV